MAIEIENTEIIKTAINKKYKIPKRYFEILVTGIVSSILTLVGQYLLQNSKLSSEQEYWSKRYEIENKYKLNTQRLQLVDEINKDLLQLEIQAKEIKICAAASNYFTTLEEVRELKTLMVQYHKDLYLSAARIQMVSLYFGKEVDSLIPVLEKALQLNFNNNLLTKKSGIKLPEFELDFETIESLTKSRNALTKAMVDEIFKPYESN